MKYVFDSTGACNTATLKKLGVIGVIRYVAGGGDWKHITKSEAAAYRKAGIAIAYCYEAGAGWMLNGDGGRAVRAALAAIKDVSGPANCFVWLACDVDVSSGNFDELERCMAQAAKAHPRGKAGVGIYGEYSVCRHFERLGYDTWQTVAWSHGEHEGDSALYQHAGKLFGHLGFDYDVNDVLHPNWGQEKPPASVTLPQLSPWPGNFGPPGGLPLRTSSARRGTKNYRAITVIQGIVGAAQDGVMGTRGNDSSGNRINLWRKAHGLAPRSNGVWDKDCWKIAFPKGWS